MNDLKYDTDFDAPYQRGRLIESVDPINRAKIWKQSMGQKADLWTPLRIDSAGPRGGFLIKETEPTSPGAGLFYWDRIFAEVPRLHKEPAAWTHTYQFVTDDLYEVSIGTVATVEHEYFRVADPTKITIIRASRFTKVGDTIYYIGDLAPTALRLVAADSTLERWMGSGNIWLRKTPYVAARTLRSLVR